MTKDHTPGARRVVPRSRGALSGIALMVLGAWGALIPFIGPYFNFSYTPDKAWHWTAGRGWLEVLPGAVAFVAGFLLFTTRSRTVSLVAAWLGIAAGAWFVIGRELAGTWHIGSAGRPANTGSGIRILETLAMFTLLGVVIVYFASTAFGRLSVVSLRDAHAAEKREAEAAAEADRRREIAAARDRDEASAREREAAAAAAAHERTAGDHDGNHVRHDRDHDGVDDRVEGDRTGSAAAAPPVGERVGDGAGHVHDHRALGAHSGAPEPGQQGQQGYIPQQGQQGYIPQQGQQGYVPQQGQQGYVPQQGQPEGEQQHESLGQRLFHRR